MLHEHGHLRQRTQDFARRVAIFVTLLKRNGK